MVQLTAGCDYRAGQNWLQAHSQGVENAKRHL